MSFCIATSQFLMRQLYIHKLIFFFFFKWSQILEYRRHISQQPSLKSRENRPFSVRKPGNRRVPISSYQNQSFFFLLEIVVNRTVNELSQLYLKLFIPKNHEIWTSFSSKFLNQTGSLPKFSGSRLTNLHCKSLPPIGLRNLPTS